jgi:nitrate reductase NapAB chaperone NapD
MSEYHIASFIVRCHAGYLETIVTQIQNIVDAEVHDQDPMGKIIVTVEGTTHRAISKITEQIRDMAHVVDLAAVYHEYAPNDVEFEGNAI